MPTAWLIFMTEVTAEFMQRIPLCEGVVNVSPCLIEIGEMVALTTCVSFE